MFAVLNAYLFQHRSISIPGLGTIYLETMPAAVDVADRTMLPPMYQFRFDKYFDAPDKEFFAFIANQRHILDFEAIKWYNEFAFDLRNRIKTEDEVNWEGVGVLKKDGSGNVLLEPFSSPLNFMQPTPAVRVLHQDAQHTLLVGDRERTTGEMNEWRQHEEEEEGRRRGLPWWVIALIIAVAGLAFLGWYFYSHGLSTASQNKF
ncbi:hypothetical protein [Puia dinghuensis]|uniref:CCDC81-like prokaryotic HU domain-containing protein n=1 Tax=Puia dinghuensis TaxID=1792502 RepID=A0A8J2XS29_9BACT|nr:hypothetical protein [Puia dinghuensis]GGA91939.1 hypothetical protein GCM10011511_14150 [Puia dinghuensis]